MQVDIIYRDENLIAINKPHGLLVHRSTYVGQADAFAIQLLRDQIGQRVYPCHRIDRKTGGALLFALNKEINTIIQSQFAANEVAKKYIAVVRGYTEDSGIIDYPLKNEKGKVQSAVTEYITLNRVELDLPFGNFNTSRYSLVEIYPKTGRIHQIRKHLAHIFHPIIGDRPHGCNKQNKLFKEKFNMATMLLHARELKFINPLNKKEEIVITADFHSEFKKILKVMGWNNGLAY